MRPRAFTLIELLVVVSICAVLLSLVLPALAQARDAAQTALCKSRIRNLNQAIENYRADYREWYPVSSLTVDTYWPGANYTFMPQIDDYIGIIKKDGVPQVTHLGIKSSPKNNYIMCPATEFTSGLSLTDARKVVYDGPNGRYGNYWINSRFGLDGSSFSYAPTKTVPGRPSTTIMLGEVFGTTYTRFGHATTGISVVTYNHPLSSTQYLMADGAIRQTTAKSSTQLNLEGMYIVNGP